MQSNSKFLSNTKNHIKMIDDFIKKQKNFYNNYVTEESDRKIVKDKLGNTTYIINGDCYHDISTNGTIVIFGDLNGNITSVENVVIIGGCINGNVKSNTIVNDNIIVREHPLGG